MYIYNITIQITHAIHEPWLQWMQQIHIPAVMATHCFTNYTLVRLLDIDESEGVTYAVQYKAASKQDYERYISHFSPALRQASIDAWGNQFIAFRSLMQVVH
ncbi:MAG: DUF4286 family protein [Chitinophagaceae bacterium]